jgi:branched-chain amino acid transport system permease protein
MDLFSTAIVSGLFLGGTYALIALGLVLVFRATNTFNFAHGQAMLLAAYVVGKYANGSSASFLGTFGIGLVLVAAISVAFYILVLRRLVGQSLFLAVIATLGLGSLLDGIMGVAFRTQQYAIENPLLPKGSLHVFGARVQTATVLIAAVSLAIAGLIALVLQKTQLGIRVRAAGQSPLLASQGGINVRAVYILSWATAGILAGLAGLAYGSTAIVTPALVDVANLALPAMMLGGLDSFVGAIVGGVIIGVLQGLTATYVGSDHVDAITYAVLLLVLLVRPSGLFGTKIVTRV